MPASKSILAATQTNNANVFASFKAHTNTPRNDTRSTVLKLLRDAYTDYHVTEVDARSICLFDFAASGKAEYALDSSDESFNATREWNAVGEGIEKKMHPGVLSDSFRFARFQYIFESNEYIVYYLMYQDQFRSPDKIFYILFPRGAEAEQDTTSPPETDALILAAGKWSSQLHEEIFVFDDGHWSKSRELFRSVKGSSWADVILDADMKTSLIDDVQGFFDNRELYRQFAVPWKRGVILHGVPGNGKTVSIKALMNALNQRDEEIPSLYVKSLETNCNTEQYSIRTIFTKARSMAPCLLVFEDLDSLVHDDIRSYFLNEVDGLESNDGILMIGSTNHLDQLDPAIAKRPSRFDRKYHFKLPGREERMSYAMYWRNKLLKNETVEFSEEAADIVAQLTEGFSFAYLKELFVMALLSLVRGAKISDDFEVVDEKEADATSPPEKVSDPVEMCTCATKCKDCNKPLPAANASDAAKRTEDAKEADKETEKNKMVLPTVEIPEHLQNNLLLKVIKHQIRVLHAEMDNTKDYEEKKKVDGSKAGMKKGKRGAKMR